MDFDIIIEFIQSLELSNPLIYTFICFILNLIIVFIKTSSSSIEKKSAKFMSVLSSEFNNFNYDDYYLVDEKGIYHNFSNCKIIKKEVISNEKKN